MNIQRSIQILSKWYIAFRAIDWKNRRTQAVVAGIVVAFGAAIYALVYFTSEPDHVAVVQLRPVELVDVSGFIRQGEVKTTESGDRVIVVRAEVGGKITRVAQKDTRVSLGQIVAELENASQRAALLQAEGSLDSANAGLSKIRRGGREEQQSILGTNVSSAQSNLATARESAVSSLNSAYAAVEDAVHRKTDTMFDGPDTNVPNFSVPTTETQLATQAESVRITLGGVLKRQSERSDALSVTDDLFAEIKRTDAELRSVRSYLDVLITVVNKAIPTSGITASDIATFKVDLNAARSSISTAISNLTSARETLTAREAAIDVAQQNLEQGATADEADVLSASASVKQAQGAYASALAAYQKTIIRAPASGVVIACSPRAGDVISTGADVCRITASGAASGTSFALPLSAVKYTPGGAYVFTVEEDGTLQMKSVETGLVSANSITVAGLLGDERIVHDVRGLREGEKVQVVSK